MKSFFQSIRRWLPSRRKKYDGVRPQPWHFTLVTESASVQNWTNDAVWQFTPFVCEWVETAENIQNVTVYQPRACELEPVQKIHGSFWGE